jgi:hypothetical protein
LKIAKIAGHRAGNVEERSNANREIHPANPAGWRRVGVPGWRFRRCLCCKRALSRIPAKQIHPLRFRPRKECVRE